jgi:ornithine carbamoyltransferase
MQLSRGESIGDVGRVLSRYVHAIVIRSGSHARVVELATSAEVPVVNALTPEHHPCQTIADLQTLQERFGSLDGLRVAFVGDGNNVARSLALLGPRVGVDVVVSSPPGLELEGDAGAELIADPAEAVAGADAVYTDVWISMGEPDAAAKREALAPYRVDDELLAAASERAVVLHCLPAHPGEEIAADVLYGPRSAVFDQAENRLHAQKALLELLVG